jgi:transcriptional regulator with XRE-family HTH domain
LIVGLSPPPSGPSPSSQVPPSSQAGPSSQVRRAELADFLRKRRAAIQPDDVGPAPGVRPRRTPGLRREEVAQRSGVGLSWYTWLEQGRDVSPSDQVLSALSRALELSPSEREHLFRLAGAAPPPPEGPDTVDPLTAALVDGLLPHLAFVLSPRFDVVAHNRAAELIMADLVRQPRPNLLRWLFAGDGWGGEAWEQTARANIQDFRTSWPDRALVDELSAESPRFREWWSGHDVQAMEPAAKHIRHPTLGPLHLLMTQSRPAHAPALRLRILVPADDHTRDTIATALSAPAD